MIENIIIGAFGVITYLAFVGFVLCLLRSAARANRRVEEITISREEWQEWTAEDSARVARSVERNRTIARLDKLAEDFDEGT